MEMDYSTWVHNSSVLADTMGLEEAEAYHSMAMASAKRAKILIVFGITLIGLSVAVVYLLRTGLIYPKRIDGTFAEIAVLCGPFVLIGFYLSFWAYRLHQRAMNQVSTFERALNEKREQSNRLRRLQTEQENS